MKVLVHSYYEMKSIEEYNAWNKFLEENEKQSRQTSGRKWEVDFTRCCLIVQDWTKAGREKLVYVYPDGHKVYNRRRREVFDYKQMFFEKRGTSWSKSNWELSEEKNV